MKVRSIAFLLFFICCISPAMAQNITDANGLKQGKWSKKDDNGKLKYEGQFKDNIPFGTFTYFHSNSKQKAISVFSDSGKKTHTTMFSYDGIKEAEGNFYNQQKDSIWIYYDVTGKTILSKESYQNNKRHGAFISYHKNGLVSDVTNYTNGKKNGLWQVFYEDGKPRIAAKYVAGELDSAYNVYSQSGTKKIEGQYNRATKFGNWFFYDDLGAISKQEMYKDGKFFKTIYHNGTFKNYFSDDVLKEEFTYLKGKKNGLFIEYYNNGTFVKKEKTNTDGSTETVEVLEGQTIKSKGEYKDDKKTGKFIYYKENGKVEREEKFE